MRRVAVLFALPAIALLAASYGADAQAARKAHARSARPAKDSGSGETTAQRDRRLTRECKGRPNAGACLGYAH
jgi:hypothetical protein